MLFSDYYDFYFIIKSKTKDGDFAKTYVGKSSQQAVFLSLILISGDISPYTRAGFIILRKYKNKYLAYNSFALQNTTFKKIIHKYLGSEKI